MPMIKHVLVATDFSAASAHALRVAADFAAGLGARLSIAHVVLPPPYPYPVPPSDQARATASGQLDDLVASVGGGASAVLREGSAAEAIATATAEIGADLVVIGSRGRRGASRALLGSVAEKVVRLSPAPVLTVHPWRFEDRSEAGRELAEALRPVRSAAPGLIAISRGALVVAAEVGRSFDETPDLLLAIPVRHGEILLGALSETGTVRLDPSEAARSVSPLDGDVAFAAARGLLTEESTALRGSGWIGDVYQRTMVVVADALDEPWSVLAVCDVLRGLHASRVIVAAPAASTAARAAVASEVDEVIVVHTTDYGAAAADVYRDERPVTVHDAAKCLRPRHSPG